MNNLMTRCVPLTTALLALSLSFAPSFAHAKAGAHAGHHGGRLAKLTANLGLTDAQKAQFKPIVKAQHQQAKAIKADTSLTPEARKSQLKELRRTTRSQMLPILTPEQQAKLAAMKGHHHKKAA